MCGHPCGQDAIVNWPYKDYALQCYDFDADGDNELFFSNTTNTFSNQSWMAEWNASAPGWVTYNIHGMPTTTGG